MIYKTKCQGSGRGWRRPAFNWVRYFMMITLESTVQVGTKSMYLSQNAYIRITMEDEDVTKEVALQLWHVEYQKCVGTKRMSKCGKKILVKTEDYVVSFEGKTKSDNIELGTKQVANPTDQDISERLGWAGTDHERFDSDFFTSSLGMDKDSLSGHRENGYSVSSKPTKQQLDDAEDEKEQKAAKKAKADTAREEKKLGKVFEKDAVLSALVPELEKAIKGITEKYEDIFAKSAEMISKILGDPNKTTYDRALQLLNKRLDCAKAAVFVDGDSAEPSASRCDEHKDAFNTYMLKPEFLQWRAGSSNVEPYPKLEKVQTLSEIMSIASSFDAQSLDDVKNKKKDFKEVVDAFKGLLGKVQEQKTRLVSLYNRAGKERVNKEVSKLAEEEKQADVEKKKQAAKPSIMKTIEPWVYTRFNLFDKVKDAEKMEFDAMNKLSAMPRWPVVCKDPKLDVPSDVTDKLKKWVDNDFKDSGQYSKSGRGAQLCDTAVGAINKLIDPSPNRTANASNRCSATLSAPTSANHGSLQAVTMASAGPEFAFLGSTKLQIAGSREVMFAPFDEIKRVYLEENEMDEEELVANNVVKCFAACDMGHLNKIGPLVGKVLLSPGSVLVMPWGFIVAEKSINGECNSGIRWLEVDDVSSVPFETVAEAVLPCNHSQVKGNSSLAFLVRVLNFLYVDDQAVKGKSAGKSSKSTPALRPMLLPQMRAKMESLHMRPPSNDSQPSSSTACREERPREHPRLAKSEGKAEGKGVKMSPKRGSSASKVEPAVKKPKVD